MMRRAFSLIELLVEIVILAILAGLLMPVFVKARGRATKAISKSSSHHALARVLNCATNTGTITLACSAGAIEASHVLIAMGFTPDQARGALRLTLGRMNSDADVDYLLKALPEIVNRLRAMRRSH